MHRAKSILAALAAVALSATAVFAAAGTGPVDAARDGLARAHVASGQSVPVGAESPDSAAAPDANKAPEANESPDLARTTANAGHPDNHGARVSAAAQSVTPGGFANHGAYVRSIAKANHSQGKTPVTTPVRTPTQPPTPAH